MTTEQRQNRIIAGFILLSLLLHLLLLLVPKLVLFPADSTPEPVYVKLRPPQQRERELDLTLYVRSWISLAKPRPSAWQSKIRWSKRRWHPKARIPRTEKRWSVFRNRFVKPRRGEPQPRKETPVVQNETLDRSRAGHP